MNERRTDPDEVAPLEVPFAPHPDPPGPILVSDENHCHLIFKAQPDDGGEPQTAVMTAVGCALHKFGYPNDEALAGHPLYPSGLAHYGVFEVLHSSWVGQLDEQNRRVLPGSAPRNWRHFAVTFHDSTFECLASEFKAVLSERSLKNAVAWVTALLEEHTSD